MKDRAVAARSCRTGSMLALQGDRRATPSASYSAREAGAMRLTKKPGDRAASQQNPRERDRTRCDRDSSVQHVLTPEQVRAGWPTFKTLMLRFD